VIRWTIYGSSHWQGPLHCGSHCTLLGMNRPLHCCRRPKHATISGAGAGALRLQRLTLRMAPKRAEPVAAAGALLAPSASLKQFGTLGSLPGIQPRLARSRRPSALAMQMGLVPGGALLPEPIPQVCCWYG
jgi:hypothetical protein